MNDSFFVGAHNILGKQHSAGEILGDLAGHIVALRGIDGRILVGILLVDLLIYLIDQGEDEGITLDAPVICSEGLIGVVTEVSAHYATVTTMLSPELSIGAVILQTGDSGIVEGDLRYAVNDRAKMMYIDEHSTAKEGDLIITAGTTGLFPYGLQVGSITETGLEESGLARYAILAPSVDFSALESVTVLLDFEGKGETFGEG